MPRKIFTGEPPECHDHNAWSPKGLTAMSLGKIPPWLIAVVLEAGVIGTAIVFAFKLDVSLALAWLVVANVGIVGGLTAQPRMKGKLAT